MPRLQWIQDKIVDRVVLARRCAAWRASGARIVFTNGCFDLLHPGHLDYLARAADAGNRLVVGLNSDASVRRLKGPERPVNGDTDRAFALASLLVVDAVCLFEEDTPLNLIRAVRPDVLVKGGDYTPDRVVGAELVGAYGGRVDIVPFVAGHSTTDLLRKIRGL